MRRLSGSVAAMAVLAGLASSAWAASVPSQMTYQGRLKESGALVTGTRSIEIYLCDLPSGGSCYSASGPQNVVVTNGLFRSTFTVANAVNLGTPPWYVDVRVGGTPLTPREALTTTPYAFVSSTTLSVNAADVKAGTLGSGVILSAGQLGSGILGSGIILAAGQLGSGILGSGVILGASQLGSGTIGSGVLLPASQLTGGIFASQVLSGTLGTGVILAAGQLGSGTIGSGVLLPASQLTGGIFASQVLSGTLGTGVILSAGQLGSGVLGSGVVLRERIGFGDQTTLSAGNLTGGGCGTTPVIGGSDSVGRILISGPLGSGTCTLNFSAGWGPQMPACFTTKIIGGNPGTVPTVGILAIGSSDVTFINPGLGGTEILTFDYFCVGRKQ